MDNLATHQTAILNDGFTVIENVYTPAEIENLITCINQVDKSNALFRQTDDLFAIRQFLKEVPEVQPIVFNNTLKAIINNLFGEDNFVVKSIYFDKPEKSNWFVAGHQDITISVDKKIDIAGYGPWTVKQNQFAVQPPISVLENNFTIRIHLDDTNEENGALKVMAGSHSRGIRRIETINRHEEEEVICPVNAGGVMIMKPLLFHSSSRTTNNNRRRVIHIEFSSADLPEGISWSEKLVYNNLTFS